METKHTPGPWEAIGNLVRSPMAKDLGSGVMLAECADRWFQKVNSEEAKANARLIAAAPEQNKALIDLLELVEELDCLAAANDPRAIAARSAIAKAIGTGDTK